ncbi:Alpha/beta hydrolase fold-1 [Echria macrotheca]|uniref:Alpha/beta hydrolase fold-1 n=1 Tax=Echria macrotheca TaxID=438768 RepID=A0AAJ0FD00_9PEZI|nr:Alpha/beta hydrolase fold-1 [Echria macrotheca]
MPSKPIIVIIPGAFHRPSHYNDVINPLQSRGYTVISIPLAVCGDDGVSPDATPADDVKILYAALLPLLDAGKEAVIVAHSYGSTPATAAIKSQTKAERRARGLKGGIVGAIWIAGFSFPVPGKNIRGEDGDMPLRPNRVLEDGLVSVTEGAKAEFYNDVEPAKADAAFASLCRFQSWRSMNTPPAFIEAEITVPKWYILCEKDQTVLPAVQESMASVGKFDRVIRLASGHAPFLSVPEEVVGVVEDFCRNVLE